MTVTADYAISTVWVGIHVTFFGKMSTPLYLFGEK